MDTGDAIEGRLPVIWHQCLLAFAQRYRDEITEDQREALLDLLLARGHRDISPEIRRELLAGRGRGVVAPEQAGVRDLTGGDDTMMD
jgi:essential nuclear protein 1